MTVAEVREILATQPDHRLIFFENGENGRQIVTSVKEEQDYYYDLTVLVMGSR